MYASIEVGGALKSEDKEARINACVELAKAGSKAAPAVQALIGVLKDIRAKLNKDAGDVVHVTLALDEAPREVEIPDDLRKALKKAKLETAFEKLSYTHRKEHVKAILGAKQEATRERRIEKTLNVLRLK